MAIAWQTFLYQPLLQSLIFLYKFLGDFGLAILALTFFIRLILIPLILPALKSSKRIQELKPHLDALKEKHGKDRQKLSRAQMELYKKHGINPAAGCLPYLIQFLVLIALYQVLMFFFSGGKIDDLIVRTSFLWLDLAKPDKYYIFPLVAGFSQLILSLMMFPKIETPQKKEGKEEMALSMQKQMLYLMPVMTVIIALKLPSGLALYWIATTVFSIIQQYFLTGWGRLELIWKRKS